MGTWGQALWEAIRQEFADLPDPTHVVRLLLRLVVAMVLGGFLGYQRERVGKSAGLRTYMLITLAAALFVLVPQMAGMTLDGLGRVIQGVATGIGFVGGGAILKLSEERQVKGLTTAAGMWLATAIGIAVGLGRLWSALFSTALAFVILSLLGRIEGWLEGRNGEGPNPIGS
jgi:putative Mg2+ transporter-C (MgtC) family protein